MPRTLTACAVLVLCVGGLFVGAAAATNNAPPLADAGLDQTVGPDATVHLDANGSRDPDGAIANVRWTIEAPDGTSTRPDCPDCRQTQFQPATTGRYTVTLNVTDDDGATRSDTLFVDVQAGTDPSVTLSGPTTVVRNRSATLTADVDAGDADLSSLAWVLDGRVAQRDSLAGGGATATLERTYTATESVSVRAVVYDSAGRRNATTHEVTVYTRAGDTGNGGNDNSEDCHFWSNNCLNDATLRNPATGVEKVVNANGEPGIQVQTVMGTMDVSELVDTSEYQVHGEGLDADVIDAAKNQAVLENTVEENEQADNEDAASTGDDGSSSDGNDDHTSYSAGSSSSNGGSYQSDSGTTMADVTSGGSDDSGSNDDDSGSDDSGGGWSYGGYGGSTGGSSDSGSGDSGDSSDDSGSNDSGGGSGGFSWGGFSGGSYF